MSPEPDLQIQRWTLRFEDPDLEDAFADHQFAISHRKLQVGLAAITLITLYLNVASAAQFHDPTVAIPNLVLLAVVAPILGLSLHPSFRRLAGPAVSVLILAQAAALTLTQLGYNSLTRDVARYDSVVTLLQLLLGAFWVFTLSGIGFRRSCVTVAIGTGAWMAVALVTSRHGLGLFSAMAIGLLLATLAGYFMELYQRRDFVRGRLLREEMEKSDRLLLNVLPEAIAKRLKSGEHPIADTYAEATILFADIVGFTDRSAREPPEHTVAMLNEFFGAFDEIAHALRLQPIKTAGDAYMVAGGVPVPRPDHAEAVAQMAVEMHRAVHIINERHGWNLSLRIGLHTGPVAAAVVGTSKFSYDIWGDTVNVASRMESLGRSGATQVTADVFDRLSGQFNFTARGPIEVKGKGPMETYFLE